MLLVGRAGAKAGTWETMGCMDMWEWRIWHEGEGLRGKEDECLSTALHRVLSQKWHILPFLGT